MDTFEPLNDGKIINIPLWRWNATHPYQRLGPFGPGTPHLPEPPK